MFVVVSQTTGFSGDAFEQVVDEAVHDANDVPWRTPTRRVGLQCGRRRAV